jgi:hypothetical protein
MSKRYPPEPRARAPAAPSPVTTSDVVDSTLTLDVIRESMVPALGRLEG